MSDSSEDRYELEQTAKKMLEVAMCDQKVLPGHGFMAEWTNVTFPLPAVLSKRPADGRWVSCLLLDIQLSSERIVQAVANIGWTHDRQPTAAYDPDYRVPVSCWFHWKTEPGQRTFGYFFDFTLEDGQFVATPMRNIGKESSRV